LWENETRVFLHNHPHTRLNKNIWLGINTICLFNFKIGNERDCVWGGGRQREREKERERENANLFQVSTEKISRLESLFTHGKIENSHFENSKKLPVLWPN
jgi:hypothetical protein